MLHTLFLTFFRTAKTSCTVCYALCFLYTAQLSHADEASDYSTPFQAGDAFSYSLYWSGIKVGEAVLDFKHATLGEGETEYLLMRFKVETTGLANRLYRVDNLLQTWIDQDTWRPVFHTKRQREGGRERDIELAFDWENKVLQYSNRGEKRDPVELVEGTQDPLSLLGWIAGQPFFEGARFSVPATDGRAPSMMEAEIVEKTSVRSGVGDFHSFKADVSTDELRGVFSKSPDAVIEVWFSEDAFRVPLRMRSEVRVGSFYGELTSYRSKQLDSHEDLPSFIGEQSWRSRRRGR